MSPVAIFMLLIGIGQSLVNPSPATEAEFIRRPPLEVKAVYVTSSTTRGSRMEQIIDLVNSTEVNAVVINVKEPSGEKFWPGLSDLITSLKNQGIWTIARVVVFQSNDLPPREPRLALKYSGGSLWRDRAGGYWLDPAAKEVWEYNANLAKRTLDLGFDEINLDYIRFPTDGDVDSIIYPAWDKKTSKERVITDFAHYIVTAIKNYRPHAVVSADIYAFTLVQDWDLDMGQRARLLAQEFDVLSPMIYPSHYRSGNFGLTNPAEYPSKVAKATLDLGRAILGDAPALVRPWFQDFNLGANYTPALVRQQIEALADAGYRNGWMLWNPSNVYTSEALNKE